MQAVSPKTQEVSSRIGMDRVWIAAGSVFGLLSVTAGAIGTHFLRRTLEAGAMSMFETAVRFQMYHALALLAVGLLAARLRTRLVNAAGGLLTAGVLFFCGSLYGLALTEVGAFGALAPIGGVCLMAGWAVLVVAAIAKPSRQ